MCNVRPHLSLRLGTASVLPFLRSIVTPARVQPSCLLSLLLLKTVSERRASARITVTRKGVTCDTGRNLHVAVFFRFLSQSRVSIRVASSVTLGARERDTVNISDLKTRVSLWKIVWKYLQKLTICTPYVHARPGETQICSPKDRYENANSGTIPKAPSRKTRSPSTVEWMNGGVFT